MATMSIPTMRRFLSEKLSSLNENKLNGLLAEVDFRKHLESIGFSERVSPGGWILRRKRQDFGRHTIVLFPETIKPNEDYPPTRQPPQPPLGLHTVCATFHQTGIHAYFCHPIIKTQDDTTSVEWFATQLGIPMSRPIADVRSAFDSKFVVRERKYSGRRYKTDATKIPEPAIPEEFSKENLLAVFSKRYLSEISDVDGVFWGDQFTYPLEIKEKTSWKKDKDIGEWFGLDVGPFVKLAFYAAKRGNLHSLFVVREIDDEKTRNLVNWWFITYEQLARFAVWGHRGGGEGMRGGASSVVKIPKAQFSVLNRENLENL